MWVIEPPREGTMNRAKVLIAGIVKHALSSEALLCDQHKGAGKVMDCTRLLTLHGPYPMVQSPRGERPVRHPTPHQASSQGQHDTTTRVSYGAPQVRARPVATLSRVANVP
jgi:hypothetical protein